jgi:hypothetical protein
MTSVKKGDMTDAESITDTEALTELIEILNGFSEADRWRLLRTLRQFYGEKT